MRPRGWRRVAAAVLPAALAACTTIGTGSVPRDRTAYTRSMADSMKEQTLLNVVALRYGDTPVLVDVSSMISNYELTSQVNLGLTLQQRANLNSGSLGGSTIYTDRPTVTYTPVVGDKLLKELLSPIPPVAIFSLLNAGYPADVVLGFTVRSINGVFNKSRFRDADPDFPKLLAALREIQRSESLHTQIERAGPNEATLIVLRGDVPPDVEDEIQLARRILKLRPGIREIALTLGTLPRSDAEIAVLSRSMLDILIEISTTIEVPPKDVVEKRTYATHEPPAGTTPPLRVHWSDTKPPEAFTAVSYRGHWFWIDDRDLESKRSFFFLQLFFSVAETGVAPQIPVITVPAH